MTTLTPSQRLAAYKWALENFRTLDFAYPFICQVLKKWLDDNKVMRQWPSYKLLYKNFPEFRNRKPKGVLLNDSWFAPTESGNAQREALLKECIMEVEKLIEDE